MFINLITTSCEHNDIISQFNRGRYTIYSSARFSVTLKRAQKRKFIKEIISLSYKPSLKFFENIQTKILFTILQYRNICKRRQSQVKRFLKLIKENETYVMLTT